MCIRVLINEDESAVSPVIGVILMVAITVILAAVIASFVLGMGPDTAQTPTASFSSQETSANTLEITMESGESINENDIRIAGYSNGSISSDESWSAFGTDTGDDSDISAGSQVKVEVGSDYEVRLVYVEGDTTSTLQTFEG